jgi:hypothetical protein
VTQLEQLQRAAATVAALAQDSSGALVASSRALLLLAIMLQLPQQAAAAAEVMLSLGLGVVARAAALPCRFKRLAGFECAGQTLLLLLSKSVQLKDSQSSLT